MDYNKFKKALDKAIRKDATLFPNMAGAEDDLKIFLDSYCKRGLKWVADNTTGEIHRVATMASSFRGSVLIRVQPSVVLFNINDGKSSQTFKVCDEASVSA